MMGAAGDEKPGASYYTGLLRSPFADMLSLEFARAAIAGEQLGRDDAPDILAISLSGHDYVNHLFSAESRLSHDHMLHLDRMLQAFFRDLDTTVGAGNYMVVLTADHGFMPAPEYSKSLGRDAGRVDFRRSMANINEGLARRFGPGKWMMDYSSATLLFDKKLAQERNVSLDALADAARTLLLAEPGFDTAYTRAELLSGSRKGDKFFDAQRKAWHPDVSGEVQFSLKPYWMFTSASASTHGSPHPYDTNVPILVYGPRWVKPGRIDAHVEVADIAPTLAGLLKVPAPATAEGKPLPLVRP
jgi:arylsulfatase A-like enzyme